MPIAKHEGVKEEKLSANTSNSQGNEKDNKKETTTTTTNKPQQGTSKSSDSDKTQPHPSTTEVHNTSRICSATSEASGKCEGGGGGGEGDAIEEDKRTKETSEITTSNNKRKETEAASKFPQPSSSNQQTASCSSNTSSTQQTSHYHHQQQHQHLSLQQSHQESSSSSSSPSSSATPASSSSNNGRSNCTKLFCGSGSGSSDSKRKDVDENNMNGSSSGNCDTGSKWRKSSRKGSKKKEKYALKEMIHDPHHTGFTQVTGDGVSGESGDIQHCFNSASVENGGTNATSNQQSQQSGAHDRKSCCFCWCCCCSCSCLPVKNQGKTGKENSRIQPSSSLEHYFNGNGEQPPSLEEIRLWAESFDKLMKCPWGRKVFRDFLKCEYSEENILFWLACEDLKNESNPEVIEEKARIIYEDYISILSPKEVSLDSRVREIINKNMVNPSPRTFDEAQLQIYTLMHRDSYPRFINSPMYRKLAQLPSPSRKGSTA